MSDAINQPNPQTPEPSNPPPQRTPKPRRKFLRRLAYCAGILLLGLVAFSVWITLRPGPGPTAYTLLHISRQPPRFIFQHGEKVQTGEEFEAYGKEQAALVKIRPVLNAALRTPGVASVPMIREQKDPTSWLERHVEVSFDKDTGIMRIGLHTGPPEDQVLLVKAVRDAYLQEIVYKEGEAMIRRLSKLKEFYLKNEDELRHKKNMLKDMAKSAGGVNDKWIVEKQKLKQELLDHLRQEILGNYSNMTKVKVKLALAERQKKTEDVTHYQADLEYLKLMAEKLQTDFEMQAKDLRDLGDKAVDLDFFQKEINSLENLANVVAAQKRQLEIEMDAPPRVRELQDPVWEDSPRDMRNLKGAWHDLRSWLGL